MNPCYHCKGFFSRLVPGQEHEGIIYLRISAFTDDWKRHHALQELADLIHLTRIQPLIARHCPHKNSQHDHLAFRILPNPLSAQATASFIALGGIDGCAL